MTPTTTATNDELILTPFDSLDMQGNNTYSNGYGEGDFYAYYLEYCKYYGKTPVDKATYKMVTRYFNRIHIELVTNGNVVRTPIGRFCCSQKNINLSNLKKDFKTGGLHLNTATDYFYAKYTWHRNKIVRETTIFSYIPARGAKRYLAGKLKKRPELINRYVKMRKSSKRTAVAVEPTPPDVIND